MLRKEPNTARADLGQVAFDEFKRIAARDQANGAETLAYERLVRQFSTAPKEETEGMLVLLRYWSRNGDTEALIKYGGELRTWATDYGYPTHSPA